VSAITYMPWDVRSEDYQYRTMLVQLLKDGIEIGSAHDEQSLTVLAPNPMHFNLSNGVPLLTERSLHGIYKSSIGELFAFVNGVHTLEGLRAFGVSDRFWDRWVTEKKCAKRGLPAGDLGPGSYGPAFHD
jgi:thymidylate synthase